MGDLTQHFSTHEVTCRCGCGFAAVDWLTLYTMEEMRRLLGDVPVRPLSVCRCRQHNRDEGGATNSQHMYGRACDFNAYDAVNNESDPIQMAYLGRLIQCPEELRLFLKRPYLVAGIGVYTWGVHLDVRPGSRLTVWGPLRDEFLEKYGSPVDIAAIDDSTTPGVIR